MTFELALSLLKKYWQPLVIGLILIGIYAKGHHDGEVAQEATTAKVQAQFDKFVSDTAQLGKAAQEKADKQQAEDKQRKEDADRENQTTIAALNADIKRLRNRESSRGNILPPAAPTSRSPETACLDRSEFESAYRQLVTGLQAVGEDGDKAIVDLNTAKRWGSSQGAVKDSLPNGFPPHQPDR